MRSVCIAIELLQSYQTLLKSLSASLLVLFIRNDWLHKLFISKLAQEKVILDLLFLLFNMAFDQWFVVTHFAPFFVHFLGQAIKVDVPMTLPHFTRFFDISEDGSWILHASSSLLSLLEFLVLEPIIVICGELLHLVKEFDGSPINRLYFAVDIRNGLLKRSIAFFHLSVNWGLNFSLRSGLLFRSQADVVNIKRLELAFKHFQLFAVFTQL